MLKGTDLHSFEKGKKNNILLGVFFLSLSLLALEVLFIRLVSILIWPVSTYVIISLALLGFGFGGTMLALRTSSRPLPATAAGAASIAFAGTVILALIVMWFASQMATVATVLPVVLGLPFACGGLAIALALSLPGTHIHQVYFVDLFGAGLGAVGVLVGIGIFGGLGLGTIIVGLGLIAGGLFASIRRKSGWGWCILGVMIMALGWIIPFPKGFIPISPKELARFTELSPEVKWEYQGWSPIARVDVLSLPGEIVELTRAFEFKLVTQDGGAPSILLQMPDVQSADFGDHTVFGIPYWIKSQPQVLIIGLGGGPDVQVALHYEAASVTGVEINPQMIKIAQEQFADFIGQPYTDPRVTIIEGDGRHIVRLSDNKYDIIQLTGVDTTVATLGGNPNLAENYLYTVEAFREFYKHLTPNGTLSVSFPDAPGLGLRLMATAVTALREEGVVDPGQHLVVSTTGGYAHVLVKHSPFTAVEIATLQDHFSSPMIGLYFPLYHRLWGQPSKAAFSRHEILYAPGLESPDLYTDLLKAFRENRERGFLAAQPWMVLPSTDNWPFFFVLDKWGYSTPNFPSLVYTLILLGAFSFACIIIPLIIFRHSGLLLPRVPALVLYFSALGLGYIFVEVVFIQKLSLFLGHPSYALAVTLCTLLVSSGLGSLASGRSANRQSLHRGRTIQIAAGGVAILTFVFVVLLDPLFHLLLPWPLALRFLVSVIIVAAPGFLMGIPFPSGLSNVKLQALAFVPWAWAINSTATVIGTLAAVLLAMLFGFTAVFLCAGGLYILAVGSAFIAFSKTHQTLPD